MTVYPKNRKKSGLNKKALLAICVVLVVGALVVLEASNITHLFHHQAIVHPTASQSTKGEQAIPSNAPPGTSTTATNNSAQAGDDKNNGSTGSSATLLVPSGNFVSAHHITLAAPISSVCNTTPGAACTISFIKAGVTKSLTIETTDRGGSAYWNWKAQDIGLTSGTWSITAVATLNGQTKSASDAQDMEVSP